MDPIADMLTSIRNAQAVLKETVKIPFSKFKFELAKVLEKNGFVKKVEKKGRGIKRIIEIKLKQYLSMIFIIITKLFQQLKNDMNTSLNRFFLPVILFFIFVGCSKVSINTSKPNPSTASLDRVLIIAMTNQYDTHTSPPGIVGS